mmetsp:Transcript_87255/g.247374  ORF Transcript_87255/g.247374 Transcript_87255/m.247374 type:complete len:204 (-) Transcript_87255:113-724(-)
MRRAGVRAQRGQLPQRVQVLVARRQEGVLLEVRAGGVVRRGGPTEQRGRLGGGAVPPLQRPGVQDLRHGRGRVPGVQACLPATGRRVPEPAPPSVACSLRLRRGPCGAAGRMVLGPAVPAPHQRGDRGAGRGGETAQVPARRAGAPRLVLPPDRPESPAGRREVPGRRARPPAALQLPVGSPGVACLGDRGLAGPARLFFRTR